MISIDIYKIEDDASGICEEDTYTRYKLIMYRIFVKKKGEFFKANNLSIYYRFFTKHYADYPNKRLDFDKLQIHLNTLREKRSNGLTYSDLLTRFADKDPKSECIPLANILNKIYDELDKSNDVSFKAIFGSPYLDFTVNNKDCIYYPNVAQSGKRSQGGKRSCKNKNKKRKTRKNIKPL